MDLSQLLSLLYPATASIPDFFTKFYGEERDKISTQGDVIGVVTSLKLLNLVKTTINAVEPIIDIIFHYFWR